MTTQPPLPIDKTFRMAVKLVSTEGNVLPFEGFVLVPEARLDLLEKVARAARDFMARQTEAVQNPNRMGAAETARKALVDRLGELEKVWDIPK